jgi:hypothetical protein
MRKLNSIYDYNAKGGSKLAAFQNDFIEKFWESFVYENKEQLGLIKNRENYFAINRALCEAIQKHVSLLCCKYVVREEELKLSESYVESKIKHIFAHQLADEIIKNDYVVYHQTENPLMRETHYETQVPFIISKDPTDKQGEKV